MSWVNVIKLNYQLLRFVKGDQSVLKQAFLYWPVKDHFNGSKGFTQGGSWLLYKQVILAQILLVAL